MVSNWIIPGWPCKYHNDTCATIVKATKDIHFNNGPNAKFSWFVGDSLLYRVILFYTENNIYFYEERKMKLTSKSYDKINLFTFS